MAVNRLTLEAFWILQWPPKAKKVKDFSVVGP